MTHLYLLSELSEHIRFYSTTYNEILSSAECVEIYFKPTIILRSEMQTLIRAMSPDYKIMDIDFIDRCITFEKVSK